MYLVLSIVVGLIIGKLLGGSFKNIIDFRLEKYWLFIAAFLIQFSARMLGLKGIPFSREFEVFIMVVSYCLLFMGMWCNRHLVGLWIIGAGTFLNSLAIALNGGKMPVDQELAFKALTSDLFMLIEKGKDIKHIFSSDNTKLHFLGDIILIPKQLAYIVRPEIVSIGDLIIALGLSVLLATTLHRPAPKSYTEESGCEKSD